MKILYGIQGTGNGHISRGRMMARHFAAQGADITYLFSGRPREQYFDMQPFGDFLTRRGLTFITQGGRIRYLSTVMKNNVFELLSDIRNLDLSGYDLVITDFEPVSAWAGKRAGLPVIGIGHQYAFHHRIPIAGANPVATNIMRWFGPAQHAIGLHWHHFDQPILPPIIDPDIKRLPDAGHTLVYLPFEDQHKVAQMLNSIKDHRFIQYSPELTDAEQGNVSLRKTCHDGFKRDMASASRVICNAGFELVSECLALGLPILVKPLHGQMEQLSNALALEKLGYGRAIHTVEQACIERWIDSRTEVLQINYPDVAKALVTWVLSGQWEDKKSLINSLWNEKSTSPMTRLILPA